ncbi:MAG: hypothetical protein ACLTSX_02700 [Collinsella sp.]
MTIDDAANVAETIHRNKLVLIAERRIQICICRLTEAVAGGFCSEDCAKTP